MKIFISYRRADSKYVVDRIRDRLIVAYGSQSVFRDIESIPLGTDFRSILESETGSCNVMLVIIGPQWAGITDAQGNKRLFDPYDYTRIEIETGLRREGILVIPVLVMNAMMPAHQDLPENLNDLLYRNAISVRNDPDFDNDIQRLILGINESEGGDGKTFSPEYFEPETMYISKGSFWMGSDAGKDVAEYESPRHQVSLPAYRIGHRPVTNKEFAYFIAKTNRQVPIIMGWNGQSVSTRLVSKPALGVSWNEAMQYCAWLSNETGRNYSLPSEAQWEKACQGKYPGLEFPENIFEWTCSLWGEDRIAPDPAYYYPWKDDDRNDANASRQIRRVVRVNKTSDGVIERNCTVRMGRSTNDPGIADARHSFRVVLAI